MKKSLAALLMSLAAGLAWAASLADFTDAQTVRGLKEALTASASAAVARLGRTDGFFGNEYDQFAGQAARFGLIGAQDARLDEYVTAKALDGLYLMMAEEEKAIRRDPVGRGGYWLGKIFGAVR